MQGETCRSWRFTSHPSASARMDGAPGGTGDVNSAASFTCVGATQAAAGRQAVAE